MSTQPLTHGTVPQRLAHTRELMRREGIRWLSSTTKSIEEIATTILQEVQPDRLVY